MEWGRGWSCNLRSRLTLNFSRVLSSSFISRDRKVDSWYAGEEVLDAGRAEGMVARSLGHSGRAFNKQRSSTRSRDVFLCVSAVMVLCII